VSASRFPGFPAIPTASFSSRHTTSCRTSLKAAQRLGAPTWAVDRKLPLSSTARFSVEIGAKLSRQGRSSVINLALQVAAVGADGPSDLPAAKRLPPVAETVDIPVGSTRGRAGRARANLGTTSNTRDLNFKQCPFASANVSPRAISTYGNDFVGTVP